MNSRVLITGGTGFVGDYLVKILISKGFSLRLLVRDEKKAIEKFGNSCEIIVGDITDAETLRGVARDVSYVIHLAAKGDVSSVSKSSYEEFVGINDMGTANLIAECKKNNDLIKFIHFSSTAAMGPAKKPIMDEKTLPNPVTPYQRSKLLSERVVLSAYEENGFPGVIIRPCMIYGVGGYGDFYKFYNLMIKGRFPKVGRGKNLTPIVHVQDVALSAYLAMVNGKPGETYIIASGESYPLDDIRNLVMRYTQSNAKYPYVPSVIALVGAKGVEMACKMMKKNPIVSYMNIKSTITDRTFDISKARKELMYHPGVKLEEGIKSTVEWFINQSKL